MNNTGQAGVGVTGPYDTKIAGLYDLLDTLGSGHFAVVKLARHVFTGEKVAVKVIDKSKLDEVSKSHLFQEVRCMKLVQHPNVVRLYEVIDTQTKLYLILELGDGGDLYDYIMRHESGLSETLARDYFRQIVRAISYCHRLHVVHRDLKPENVVFFERLGVVKLTDFGFSNKFCPGQKLETSCGSLAYSAPEILLGDSYDAPAVDVWSLGVILYMLVCGQPPFQQANDSETLTMIMDCKYSIPQHVSSECKRLIGRMLVREPEKRATLGEIASDPWVLGDGGTALPEQCDTPLVAREQLGEEERAAVLQRMVSGAIASKDQILQALERNEYNHITATYYLLAERKLRAKRQAERERERIGVGVRRPDVLSVCGAGERGAMAAGGTVTGTGGTGRSLLAPPPIMVPRTPHDQPVRLRKCSIVREEEDDEEGARSSGSMTRRPSRSEGRLHVSVRPQPLVTEQPEMKVEEPGSLSVEVTSAVSQAVPSPTSTLATNGVGVGAGEDVNVPPPPPPPPPPARKQRIEVRRRRPRAGSCSSSDLSDDDSEKKKRGEGAAGLPRPLRRDSHDDSSDSQERGAPPANRRQLDASRPALTGSGGPNGASAPPSAGAGGDARGGAGGGGAGRRRRAARHESRLRESRSLNRIAEVEEVGGGGRWGGGGGVGLVALCGRPFLRLLSAARPATSARRLHAC